MEQAEIPLTTCPFLETSPEIRRLVYKLLFASTRLSFGIWMLFDGSDCEREEKWVVPARNALAILRTCRLVHDEAREIWLREVLFHFERPEDMLDKLTGLPPAIVSNIRHLRVVGDAMQLSRPGEEDQEYFIVLALKLLPQLRLDRLTVLAPRVFLAQDYYKFVEGLIRYGNGWRELHFIAPSSKMLGYAVAPNAVPSGQDLLSGGALRRQPQPQSWQKILEERDGEEAGGSVTIYRSKSAEPGTIRDPSQQVILKQITTPAILRDYGYQEESYLMSKEEIKKELLVTVKRGRGADVVEPEGPPYPLAEDIRTWTQGMSWETIRRTYDSRIITGEESLDEDPREVIVDQYDDFDEISWNPSPL